MYACWPPIKPLINPTRSQYALTTFRDYAPFADYLTQHFKCSSGDELLAMLEKCVKVVGCAFDGVVVCCRL